MKKQLISAQNKMNQYTDMCENYKREIHGLRDTLNIERELKKQVCEQKHEFQQQLQSRDVQVKEKQQQFKVLNNTLRSEMENA